MILEAHSVGLPPTRLDTQWSSDDEPLLTVDPPTQPVSGTLPTWVDSQRPLVNVPVRNVRPRLRLQSVPSTIVDALEEDLEASAVSTVPASSRAVRRLLLVGGHAMHTTHPQW